MQKSSDKGQAKILNFLEDLTDRNDFKFAVSAIRQKLDIPSEGFKAEKADLKNLANPLYIPFRHKNKKKADKSFFAEEIFFGITPFLEYAPATGVYYALLLRNYICYGNFYSKKTQQHFPQFQESGLCQLVDGNFEMEEDLLEENGQSVYISNLRKNFQKYPITIRISPSATGVDIHDFINLNISTIRSMQEHYAGARRTESIKNRKRTPRNAEIRKRDDFIYKNRHLDISILAGLLKKKGFYLDRSYIKKIIAKEIKKRERKLGQD
jgi:hypothetical protein